MSAAETDYALRPTPVQDPFALVADIVERASGVGDGTTHARCVELVRDFGQLVADEHEAVQWVLARAIANRALIPEGLLGTISTNSILVAFRHTGAFTVPSTLPSIQYAAEREPDVIYPDTLQCILWPTCFNRLSIVVELWEKHRFKVISLARKIASNPESRSDLAELSTLLLECSPQ